MIIRNVRLNIFLIATCACLLPLRVYGQFPIIERRIDSLLSVMTLEEKLGQLNQLTGHWDEKTRQTMVTDELHQMFKKGMIGSFLGVEGTDATREYQRAAVEESRLHIPLMFGLDVIHG